MHSVFIVGGSGKVARSLARQLADRGHQPHSLYRHAEQAEGLEALGAIPVAGNLLDLDTEALAKLMAGSDTVVFAAGAGGKGGEQMTDAIDGHGLELSVAAAELAGIQRFYSCVGVSRGIAWQIGFRDLRKLHGREKTRRCALGRKRSRLGHSAPRHLAGLTRQWQGPRWPGYPLWRRAARRCRRSLVADHRTARRQSRHYRTDPRQHTGQRGYPEFCAE